MRVSSGDRPQSDLDASGRSRAPRRARRNRGSDELSDFPRSVDILAIGNVGLEPYAFRAVLEELDARVNLFRVGRASHIVEVLAGHEGAGGSWLVLSCHGGGKAGTIDLEDLPPHLAADEPFDGAMGAAEVRTFGNLPGKVVLCSGCETGTDELAAAFLDVGCRAYIAPERCPFGWTPTIYVAMLAYELRRGHSLADAVERVAAHDEELAMFRLFASPRHSSG